MPRFIHLSALLSVFCAYLVLTGCGMDTTQERPAHSSIPSPAVVQASAGMVGPGDILEITVEGESELTGTYTVAPDGSVTMPLVQAVSVSGGTAQDAANAITNAYSQGFLVSPRVRVDIKQASSVYVMGAVMRPGSYPWQDGLTVMKTGALAGGFKEGADLATFGLIRGGQETTADATTLAMPSDVIVIKERGAP
ncbi:MAG: polysaccharide export protein [Alphaproteobacteria bacterium]|nr:polysaccharide export protein [Alphaproteobacteria bacterium]